MSSLSAQGLLNSLSTFPVFSYLFGFTKDFTISLLKTGPIPKHVALIMDGNRRYAKNHNLPLKDGHSAGAETLLKVSKRSIILCFTFLTIIRFLISVSKSVSTSLPSTRSQLRTSIVPQKRLIPSSDCCVIS